jgi:hypothetical protein
MYKRGTDNNGFRCWRRTKASVSVVFAVVLAFVIAFEIYTFAVFYSDGHVKLPDNFGNFEHVRKILDNQDAKDHFSFVVVGDPRGLGTFEDLISEVRGKPLSFMVVLGDFVKRATQEHHRFFRSECAEEYKIPFPVFFVAGNHEFHYGAAADKQRATISLSDFESMYGPTNFSFKYGGCLFVIIRDLPSFTVDESIAFLQSVLSREAGKYNRAFVFAHLPLPVSADFDFDTCGPAEAGKLMGLLDQYKVDYFVAGDYHGYARIKRKDTVYLVTGGGGASLEKHNKYCRFHHAVTITVDAESVSEQILFVKDSYDKGDVVERFAITELYPLLVGHGVLTVLANLLMVSSFFMFLWQVRSPREQVVGAELVKSSDTTSNK